MYPKIFLLDHSGFLLELADVILIFDYYRDPAGILDSYAESKKTFVFFVSHSHADHWNPEIMSFNNKVPAYFILDSSCDSELVHLTAAENKQRVFFVNPHTVLEEEISVIPSLLRLYVFGSTDEGSSFLLVTTTGSFIHLGDLNDWDWQDEDSPQMEADYNAELRRMAAAWSEITNDDTLPAAAKQLVLSFVPVDRRLGKMAFKGALTFLEFFQPAYLIPMHLNGGKELPGELALTLSRVVHENRVEIGKLVVPGQKFDFS